MNNISQEYTQILISYIEKIKELEGKERAQENYIRDNENDKIPNIYNWILEHKEQAVNSEIVFNKLKSQTEHNSINVISTVFESKEIASTFQHFTQKLGDFHPQASKDLETHKDAKILLFTDEITENHYLIFSSPLELKKGQKVLSFNRSTD